MQAPIPTITTTTTTTTTIESNHETTGPVTEQQARSQLLCVDDDPSKCSFKQQPLVSSMAKNKPNAIKIQIQGSQSNLFGHNSYGRRHISFDDSCKKDDGYEVRTNTKKKNTEFQPDSLSKSKYKKKKTKQKLILII